MNDNLHVTKIYTLSIDIKIYQLIKGIVLTILLLRSFACLWWWTPLSCWWTPPRRRWCGRRRPIMNAKSKWIKSDLRDVDQNCNDLMMRTWMVWRSWMTSRCLTSTWCRSSPRQVPRLTSEVRRGTNAPKRWEWNCSGFYTLQMLADEGVWYIFGILHV